MLILTVQGQLILNNFLITVKIPIIRTFKIKSHGS